jgi:hypothetical protein
MNDLERRGVSLGHRKKLLRAIADLEADPAAQSNRGGRPRRGVGRRTPSAAVMFANLVGSIELGYRLDLDRLAPT